MRDPSFILKQLKFILTNNQPPSENPLGSLTTENRNVWATARHNLSNLSGKNEKNLKLIDSALFCLCLDDTTIDHDNPISTIRNFLFDECRNRWYDKSFSLIVSKDGTTGINFEHSWGDGVAVLRYFNEMFKETTTKPFVHPSTPSIDANVESTVRLLDFDVNDRLINDIQSAEKNHKQIVGSIDMNFLKYEGLNKNLCKQHRISPDAVMQLSFQLGFFKQHGKFVPTYESCSTAAFKHGRTETMRPCTSETKEFCEAISKKRNSISPNELRAMMDKCSAKHNALTKDAAMGQGFDRHLFGLRHTAEQNGIKIPSLFEDPAYSNINHNILSTSTLSSAALLAGGFGPVVSNGYGIGYNIQDSYLGCVISNYTKERNGQEFIECLKESYDEITNVLKLAAK